MDKKGFTLIELLAVIVILAVIALIATPIIMNAITKAQDGAYERDKSFMVDAALHYLTANDDLLPKDLNKSIYVKLIDLINNQSMEVILDPKSKVSCDTNNSGVKVTNAGNGNYSYEPFLQCANYKTDESYPGIETSVSGSSLTVKGIEAEYTSFDGISNNAYVIPSVLSGFRTFEFTFFTRELLTYTYASWPNTQVIHMNGNNTINDEFGIHNINSNQLLVGFGAEGLTNKITFSNLLNYTRYNVVFVMDDNDGKLYVNGVLVGTNTLMGYNTIGNYLARSNLTFGAHQSSCTVASCNYYKMDMENTRVWQRALTPSEILSNYENKNILNNSSLIADYDFTKPINNIVYNKVSSNYNVNLVGASYFKNTGVKEIRIKQSNTLLYSTNESIYTFNLSPGSYTIEVEDYVGNISTKTITI